MNRLVCVTIAGVLGASAPCAAATLYYIDSGADDGSSSLQSMTDITTGFPTKIGETGIILTDLAWHSTSNTLLAIDYFSRLYRVDSRTAALTVVGELGYKLYALEFCGDALYAWGDTKLVQITPETAKTTVIGDVGFRASGDLACASDGSLYGTGTGYDEDQLIRISRNTGKGTLIGVLEYSQVLGLDFDSDGTLLGVTGVGSTPIFAVSQYTGITLDRFSTSMGSQATYGVSIQLEDGSGCALTDVPSQWLYPDQDGDGYGVTADALFGCQVTTGYSILAGDCDDTSAASRPGMAETCDGRDNDCDGAVDEGASNVVQCYPDADLDGYGVGAPLSACSCPRGYATTPGDCLDSSALIHPGAEESCNAKDDDCDTQVDEGIATSTFFRDADGDAFGGDQTVQSCLSTLSGYLHQSDDCDDGNATVFPGAEETCNAADDNCDGQVDELLATSTYYPDADGDGAGDPALPVTSCAAPGTAFVSTATDCDDAAASAYPGAPELCNGQDDNCNGLVDDNATEPIVWYPDQDADGYGASESTTQLECQAPDGSWSSQPDDCNDQSAVTYPGAPELEDGIDNDCDGQTDEDQATETAGPSTPDASSPPAGTAEPADSPTETPAEPGSATPDAENPPADGCACALPGPSSRPIPLGTLALLGLLVVPLRWLRFRCTVPGAHRAKL